MPLDLSTLSPKARSAYILIGRHWSSEDTLAQADKTLNAHGKYGGLVAKLGFPGKDALRLADARDELVAAGVQRAEVRGGKKVTSTAYLAALEAGRDARKGARAILEATRNALHESTTPEAEAGVTRIDAALSQTRSADDDDKIAQQLDVLRGALSDPNVAAEADERGGADAVPELKIAAANLRAAAAARPGTRGTPAETETLDVIDGIIVTLARSALKAARVAAKRQGMPAIVSAFELSALYPPRNDQAPADGTSQPAPTTGASATTPATEPTATPNG